MTMNPQRMPRQVPDPDETPSTAGRRHFHEQILSASREPPGPQGLVAMILLEVTLAPGSAHMSERILPPVTSKLAAVFNRRLRSVDVLARTGDTELAVLLAQAHLGVAAAFSERLRQPIEQASRELDLASDIVVCMGLVANPSGPWHPDALIELADFRMRAAKQRAARSPTREWVLEVDGESIPRTWADSTLWPATSEISSYSSL
jgi:GGDEF domain-containing protein